MKAYRINFSNPDIFCVEAYGFIHHPVFRSKKKAKKFLAACAAAWPENCKEREMYSVEEFNSVEAAMADGRAVLM
jgi:hypothetical protein